jgi:hypothetical protein
MKSIMSIRCVYPHKRLARICGIKWCVPIIGDADEWWQRCGVPYLHGAMLVLPSQVLVVWNMPTCEMPVSCVSCATDSMLACEA